MTKQEDIRRKKVQQTNDYLGKSLIRATFVFSINPEKMKF